MYNKVRKTAAGAASCSAMERKTISKNRACPKSQRVGINLKMFATLAFALSAFVFTSCEKQEENNCQNAGSVYAVGYSQIPSGYSVTSLWIDNKAPCIDFAATDYTAGFVMSVYVQGDDVYMAGYQRSSSSVDYATVWKKTCDGWDMGVSKQLSNVYSTASSVFVSGSDVYVAGTQNGKPTLWKNGAAQSLSNDGAASSVFVSGNDVYVAGTENSKPTLWKNSVAQSLSNRGVANSVFVSGSNVYVAGTENGKPTLWKNGAAQSLSNGGVANSVFVSGSDVYVAGTESSKPTLWKNGAAQHLADRGDAYSVFVSGNDVYVGGNERYGTYDYSAMLWKNGVAQKPAFHYDANVSSIHSVFVK